MKKLSKKSKTKRKISKRKTLKSKYRHNGKIWDFIKSGGVSDPWQKSTLTEDERRNLIKRRQEEDQAFAQREEYDVKKTQRLNTNIEQYVLITQKKFSDLFTRFVGTIDKTLDELLRSGDPYSIQKNNESLSAAYKIIDDLNKSLNVRLTEPKGII